MLIQIEVFIGPLNVIINSGNPIGCLWLPFNFVLSLYYHYSYVRNYNGCFHHIHQCSLLIWWTTSPRMDTHNSQYPLNQPLLSIQQTVEPIQSSHCIGLSLCSIICWTSEGKLPPPAAMYQCQCSLHIWIMTSPRMITAATLYVRSFVYTCVNPHPQ